jgi:sarcosine oxidase subunit gamma
VSVTQRFPLACVNLRGRADDAKFIRAVSGATDVAPPLRPCASNAGLLCSILWLGPDEWLVISDSQSGAAIASSLRKALLGCRAAATDVSDARLVFSIAGPNARAVLAKGCSIDFHPREFSAGHCVQTLLAKSAALIHALPADRFDVYVPRSFSEYVWEWLKIAVVEYQSPADHAQRDHDC